MSVERFLSAVDNIDEDNVVFGMLAHSRNSKRKIEPICNSMMFRPAKFLAINASIE